MINRQRIVSLLLLVNLASVWSSLYALPGDRLKPLQFSASEVEFLQQSHEGFFRGNVVIDQGTTHLRANKAYTKGNANNQLLRAQAIGTSTQQAHFWTKPTEDRPEVHAFANELIYEPQKHLITLKGHASVRQGADRFQASVIYYDVLKQQVISKPTKQQQTTIIYHDDGKMHTILP